MSTATHARGTALLLALSGAALVALGVRSAAAQPAEAAPPPAAQPADLEARAVALYEEGTRLLDAGSTAEACPKLAEAVRLVPDASGAHLALGVCFERSGRLASALHHLERAEALTDPGSMADRRQRAREAAEALRPRVARVTIVVEPAGAPGLVVTVDGRPVERGVASPIDAGTHAIVLTDGGVELTRRSVEVRDGDRARVVLAAPRTSDAASPPAPALADPEHEGAGPPWATIGVIGLAVGGAGLVLGAVGGAVAADRDAASAEACDERDFCTDAGFAARDEAFTWATVSTVSFIAGGALAATGLVLVLVGDDEDAAATAGRVAPRARAEASIHPGGVLVRGTF